MSERWESHFSGVVQSSLLKPVFDHAPILLNGGDLRRGPIPLMFEDMCLKEEGFKDLFRGWWMGYNLSGTPSFIFDAKLKASKLSLKV